MEMKKFEMFLYQAPTAEIEQYVAKQPLSEEEQYAGLHGIIWLKIWESAKKYRFSLLERKMRFFGVRYLTMRIFARKRHLFFALQQISTFSMDSRTMEKYAKLHGDVKSMRKSRTTLTTMRGLSTNKPMPTSVSTLKKTRLKNVASSDFAKTLVLIFFSSMLPVKKITNEYPLLLMQ